MWICDCICMKGKGINKEDFGMRCGVTEEEILCFKKYSITI